MPVEARVNDKRKKGLWDLPANQPLKTQVQPASPIRTEVSQEDLAKMDVPQHGFVLSLKFNLTNKMYLSSE